MGRVFLRVVGAIEILFYFIGLIVLICMSASLSPLLIVLVVLYAVFAPTIGVLCLCVAGLLDDRDKLKEEVARLQRDSNKIKKATLPEEERPVKDVKDKNGFIILDSVQEEGTIVKTIYTIYTSSGYKIKEGSEGLLVNDGILYAKVKFYLPSGKTIVEGISRKQIVIK